MTEVSFQDNFASELRKRTHRKRTATQAISNLTVPFALSSPSVYGLALTAYYHIFLALETEFEKRRRLYPKLNAVYFRELHRAPAFRRDIKHYCGNVKSPSPATRAFIKNMRDALCDEPILVIAYSYALYIGILTAGPRVIPWVRTAFSVKGKDGVAAWSYDGVIEDPTNFRKRYDDALSCVVLAPEQKDRIVEQVHTAFAGSADVLTEIRESAEYGQSLSSLFFRALLCVLFVLIVVVLWYRPFRWAVESTLFMG